MNSKQKNIALFVAIGVGLYFCYSLGISKTLDERNTYRTLLEKEHFSQEIPERLSILSKKEVYFDSVLHAMNLSGNSIENDLLRILNIEAKKNGVKVLDFNNPHTFSKDSIGKVLVSPFTLEGSYTGILKTLYAIEQQNNLGEVVHLNFEKNKNYRTRKEFLTATIFLQNVN